MQNIEHKEHSYISGRNFKRFENFDAAEYQSLARIGINLSPSSVRQMMHVMDNEQPLVTTASVTTPVQFLQEWLPGFVHVLTKARKIDEILGISTVGNWHQEEVVQGLLELTGTSVPYADYSNVPFSSWNANYVRRTIVSFEQGIRVGIKEELRASEVQIDSSANKRLSAALQLEIERNYIGFFGFNNGANLTYGFLNDPQLIAYQTVAQGATGSTLWSTKTMLEISADIRQMAVTLQNQSGDNINPEDTDTTLVVATLDYGYLSVQSEFGYSVKDFLKETYPRMRIVSAPELNAANGGANVAYLFADRVEDSSTDDGKTFIQIVPAKFFMLGVSKQVKFYEEGYSNASAGVLTKRPFAVTRITGI